jgi:hypothetical protein
MTHGRVEDANKVLDQIEREFRARGHRFEAKPLPVIRLRTRRFTQLAEVARTLFRIERRRTLVGLSLMVAQAFFYNAIFFTYALVLTDFYGIPGALVGWYLLPFAAGNFLGPEWRARLKDQRPVYGFEAGQLHRNRIKQRRSEVPFRPHFGRNPPIDWPEASRSTLPFC